MESELFMIIKLDVASSAVSPFQYLPVFLLETSQSASLNLLLYVPTKFNDRYGDPGLFWALSFDWSPPSVILEFQGPPPPPKKKKRFKDLLNRFKSIRSQTLYQAGLQVV